MTDRPELRLLLVHAHPDDESIGQGATMARYAAEGRGVTLVTCTAGEMGEILVPELEHLAADQDDKLGEHRATEIANAMKALGVTDHRWLGGFQTYRDSGMKWHEDGYAIAADDIMAGARFRRAGLVCAAQRFEHAALAFLREQACERQPGQLLALIAEQLSGGHRDEKPEQREVEDDVAELAQITLFGGYFSAAVFLAGDRAPASQPAGRFRNYFRRRLVELSRLLRLFRFPFFRHRVSFQLAGPTVQLSMSGGSM